MAVSPLFGIGAASAADLPVKAPPVAVAVANWTGFYLGVNAGGSIGVDSTTQTTSVTSTALGTNGLLNSSNRLAPTGAVFGGQVGYSWQTSPLVVLGVEADWQWTSQKDAATNSTPAAATVGFFGAGAGGFGYSLATEQKVTDIGTARVRGGVLLHDTLLYATGGLAWGTVKDSYAYTGSANPVIFPGALQPGPFLPGAASFSNTRTGATVGGGVETKLGGGWSAKLEYLYVDLGTVNHVLPIAINPAFQAAVASAATSFHVTDNIVRVGVNYSFGAGSNAKIVAADRPAKSPVYKAPPVAVAVANWTGFYLGVNGGGSIGVDSTTQTTSFTSTALGANGLLNSSNRLAPTGGVFGGQVGYNWQTSPLVVLGVEADWQWTSQKDAATNSTPAASLAFFGAGGSGFGYSLATEQKVTDIGTARVRGGVLLHDTLLYATGGLAWGTVKDNYTYAGSANPTVFPGVLQPGPFLPAAASFSSTRTGGTVGAGIETKLGGGWSAKLEYLYVDLGTVNHVLPIAINPAFGAAFTTGGAASTATSFHVTDNIVRVGVNYQFGSTVVAKY